MKLVLWNTTVPMFIGFIQPRQPTVELSTLSGYIPEFIFLQVVTPRRYPKPFTYGFCGSITSTPENREILNLNKSLIEAMKKFRKSSRADLIVLKIISCGPELRPLVAPGWYFIQLCTANKANIKIGKMKSLSIPEVTPEWVCYRRALGFSVLIKKLQQVLGSGRGYMYNVPLLYVHLCRWELYTQVQCH